MRPRHHRPGGDARSSGPYQRRASTASKRRSARSRPRLHDVGRGDGRATCRATGMRSSVAVEVDGYGRITATSPGAATGSSWSSDHGQELDARQRRAADRLHVAHPPGARARQGITGSDGGEIDHIELFGPPARARRRQPQLRPVPRQGVRPLAVRHRHQRQARLPGRRRQARARARCGGRRASSAASSRALTARSGDAVLPVDHRLGLRERRGDAAPRSRATRSRWASGDERSHCRRGDHRRRHRGAACARALARRGLDVARGRSGGGRRRRDGGGHGARRRDGRLRAQFALTRYSAGSLDRAGARAAADAEYHPCGTIWVAADDEEWPRCAGSSAYCAARGVATEVLDARQLAEAEPNLRAGLAGGLLVPDDLRGVSAVRARSGCSTRRARSVWTNASRSRRRTVKSQLADGRASSAGVVDLRERDAAARSWCPTSASGRAKATSSSPTAIPGFVHHQLVELGYLKSAHGGATESVAFNVQPRADGADCCSARRGNSTSRTAAVDWKILRRMMERGFEFMPGLRGLSVIRMWTGFRAATEDNLPFIGPVPGMPKVYWRPATRGSASRRRWRSPSWSPRHRGPHAADSGRTLPAGARHGNGNRMADDDHDHGRRRALCA